MDDKVRATADTRLYPDPTRPNEAQQQQDTNQPSGTAKQERRRCSAPPCAGLVRFTEDEVLCVLNESWQAMVQQRMLQSMCAVN